MDPFIDQCRYLIDKNILSNVWKFKIKSSPLYQYKVTNKSFPLPFIIKQPIVTIFIYRLITDQKIFTRFWT